MYVCIGAQINQADKYGRTPLHVAAAVDYPEMVQFLFDNGADIHARTNDELQTPIHFAARNDAAISLKTLIKCGSNMEDRDYKNRTPLQVGSCKFASFLDWLSHLLTHSLTHSLTHILIHLFNYSFIH